MDVDVAETRALAVERFCARVVELRPSSFVLTGGRTAGDAFRLLASDGWRRRLDWQSMSLWWGDERCVPPGSDDSNFRLAEQTLLGSVQAGRVERMRGEAADLEAEGDRYGALLPERLDVLMLGMGDDGHCASLFPGEPSLDVTERACIPSHAHYAPFERLTLTFPALDRASHVLFLVTGESKAEALAAIAGGEDRPAARVHGRDGQVTWFVDRPAASRLG